MNEISSFAPCDVNECFAVATFGKYAPASLMECHASFKDQSQLAVIVRRISTEKLLFFNSCRKLQSLRKELAGLDIRVRKCKSRRGKAKLFLFDNYSINK